LKIYHPRDEVMVYIEKLVLGVFRPVLRCLFVFELDV